MALRELLSKPWMRIIVFLWVVIFPIIFVALPLLKVATGEADFSMNPVWAFLVWALAPLAVSIAMKYAGGGRGRQ